MAILDLDDVKEIVFSGGELHLALTEEQINTTTVVLARLRSSQEIMKLILITNALKQHRLISELGLLVPYFPYARQDRVANYGEPLSVKVMGDLINSLGYYRVGVLDPHSMVTPAVINNVVETDSTAFAKIVCENQPDYHDRLIFLAPDAGALKKTNKVAKAVGYTGEVVFCEKTRNTLTGEITGTKVYCDNIEGSSFIMFDDICDGGRTFIEIAKVLKAKGANKVILAVTHGIFSKGLDVIFEHIDEIYCTDSFKKIESDNKKFFQFELKEVIQ